MTALDLNDTIAAVASPAGGGWRGLVRITGPAAFGVVLSRFEDPGEIPLGAGGRPERRSGSLTVDGLRGLLPVSLSCWPGTRTYTGQPLVEIETTGSPPVLQSVLATLLGGGARLAEPGEFTLRAFLAGRIDLTQSEAVLGVIDAHSPAQLDVALRQLAGGLAIPLTRLRDDLADTLAHLEANLDFADEADVDPLGRVELAVTLQREADEVAALAGRLDGRLRSDGRPRVVLVGPPNAGKSRLFNALTGRDRSIVAATAGTTRDYLECECDCDGLLVDLVDTAGIEPARHLIDQGAQAAQVGQARIADLLLDCCPIGSDRSGQSDVPSIAPRLAVWTKADLAAPAGSDANPTTSAATGAGVAALRALIARRLRSASTNPLGDCVATTAARSGESLTAAARSLRGAAAAIEQHQGDELVAVDLRQAIDELGRVVGAVVTDDLLDRIFRRFCIGK